MNKQTDDIKLIRDYLAGRLTPDQMHRLESQALEDPLLSAALFGEEALPDETPEQFEEAMQRLENRLDSRVSQSEGEKPSSSYSAPVHPITRQATSKKKWLAAAAVVLAILAGSWFFWQQKSPNELSAPDIAEAASDLLADTTKIAMQSPQDMPQQKQSSNVQSPLEKRGQASLDKQIARAENQAAAQIEKQSKNQSKHPTTTLDSNVQVATQAEKAQIAMASPLPASDAALSKALESGRSPYFSAKRADSGPLDRRLATRKAVKRPMGMSQATDKANTMGYHPQGEAYSARSLSPNSLNIGAQRLKISLGPTGKKLDSLRQKKSYLFVINGTPIDEKTLEGVNRNKIQDVYVMGADSAKALYGNRAKEGAVLITMPHSLEKNKAENVNAADASHLPAIKLVLTKLSGDSPSKEALIELNKKLNQELQRAIDTKRLSNKDYGVAYISIKQEKTQGDSQVHLSVDSDKSKGENFIKWVLEILKEKISWEDYLDSISSNEGATIKIELVTP